MMINGRPLSSCTLSFFKVPDCLVTQHVAQLLDAEIFYSFLW